MTYIHTYIHYIDSGIRRSTRLAAPHKDAQHRRSNKSALHFALRASAANVVVMVVVSKSSHSLSLSVSLFESSLLFSSVSPSLLSPRFSKVWTCFPFSSSPRSLRLSSSTTPDPIRKSHHMPSVAARKYVCMYVCMMYVCMAVCL